jgi:hypothetical protein
MESTQALDKSFANAKGALSSAGEMATKQIVEGGVQTQADVSQSLIDSGFTDSTMAANAKISAQGQTQKGLAGLAEQIGQQQAGFEMAHGQAKAANLQGIANFMMSKVDKSSSLTPQYQASGPGLMGMLGQIGGQALGGYLGGLG